MNSNTSFKSINTPKRAKWTLFAAAVLLAPVPFFMIVVGGLIPLSAIIYMSVLGIVVAIPKGTAEGFYMLGMLLPHILIFGGLLYLLAWLVAKLLFRFFIPAIAQAVVWVLVVVLAVSSFFEIYRLPGHNSAPPANVVKLVSEFAS